MAVVSTAACAARGVQACTTPRLELARANIPPTTESLVHRLQWNRGGRRGWGSCAKTGSRAPLQATRRGRKPRATTGHAEAVEARRRRERWRQSMQAATGKRRERRGDACVRAATIGWRSRRSPSRRTRRGHRHGGSRESQRRRLRSSSERHAAGVAGAVDNGNGCVERGNLPHAGRVVGVITAAVVNDGDRFARAVGALPPAGCAAGVATAAAGKTGNNACTPSSERDDGIERHGARWRGGASPNGIVRPLWGWQPRGGGSHVVEAAPGAAVARGAALAAAPRAARVALRQRCRSRRMASERQVVADE